MAYTVTVTHLSPGPEYSNTVSSSTLEELAILVAWKLAEGGGDHVKMYVKAEGDWDDAKWRYVKDMVFRHRRGMKREGAVA